ncbi:MAG: flagellar hook-associated protein FlgK [Alphaproteobacteria bacterium]|nr:flagellar hook-associated protein FlgK [Alphaproteobacteria bacterium]
MSIAGIMGNGLSALSANQQALRAASTNVANVNTVGYSRLDVQFVNQQITGLGGVEVQISRVANAYLAAAEMRGASEAGAASVLAQFMDRAQGLMGDPSNPGGVFSSMDPAFGAFGALALDPSSSLRRSEALSAVQTLLSDFQRASDQISGLRSEADGRAIEVMEEANQLMGGIARLNGLIQRNILGGVDATDAQTEQSVMLDRLAEIIDIRVSSRSTGGVQVRTTDGALLVDTDAARLAPDSRTGGDYPGVVLIAPRSSVETAFSPHLASGELFGLLKARDRELSDLAASFGELAAGAAEALNAAHNASASLPAPQALTGRNTGLIATDRLNFSGATNIALVNADGAVTRNYRIDFSAGSITSDSGVVTSFANSIGDFQTALNGAMGANGAAAFAAGRLSLSSSVPGSGVVVSDDPANPASRAGKGFAHAFGLNDLVTRGRPLSYETGLSGADLHGFQAGQQVTFAVRNGDGAVIRRVDLTVGGGASISALRSQIDAALQGVGQTAFDAYGKLRLVSTDGTSRIDVFNDGTSRGDTGYSLSDLFGLGESLPAQRARGLAVRTDIVSDPSRLSTAQADLAGALPGARVVSRGDGRGAGALEESRTVQRRFADAGGMVGQSSSLDEYGARLAGYAGLRAQSLEASRAGAEAVREEAQQRRLSEEGVNLDEELVNMTTYQQSYAAASRLIQAARDLYDVVLRMV